MANLRHYMANSQEVYLSDSNNDRQSEIAAETGNTYISEAMIGTVKIATTNLGYETMYRWKMVLASKCNSDRQPKISIWPPKSKTENNCIYGTLLDSVEIPTSNSGFSIMTSSIKD